MFFFANGYFFINLIFLQKLFGRLKTHFILFNVGNKFSDLHNFSLFIVNLHEINKKYAYIFYIVLE